MLPQAPMIQAKRHESTKKSVNARDCGIGRIVGRSGEPPFVLPLAKTVFDRQALQKGGEHGD